MPCVVVGQRGAFFVVQEVQVSRHSAARDLDFLRTPDSIQMATAIYLGYNIFYTNDRQLGKKK